MDAAPAPRRLWQRRPSLSRQRPGAMAPAPFRVAEREQDTADTWTLTLEPRRGRGPVDRARAVHDGLRLRDRRGADLGQRPSEPSRPGRAHGARRRSGHAARSARRSPVRCSGCAGRSAHPGRSTRRRGGDVVVVAGGIGLAPLRPVVLHVLEQRADYGAVTVLYGARTPGDLLYTEQLDAVAAHDRRRGDGRRGGRATGPDGSASCRSSSPARALPARARRPRSSAGPRS